VISITPIPALDSNYIWVIRPRPEADFVYVVDPGDATAVIRYLQQYQLKLCGILITHRHRDHIEGVAELLRRWQVPVYGPKAESIPCVTHFLTDGDQLQLEDLRFQVIAVPGHTWEHIAYFSNDNQNPPLLFCGDALFAGGCGRRFDGTAEIMWDSLTKLASLPDNTLMYCTHEYTLANLEFANAVEPDNEALTARLVEVSQMRQRHEITLPSTILAEKRTNPFLRCSCDDVKRFVEQRLGHNCKIDAEVFGGLRLIKDHWPDPVK
jgi:hydroxyacylglutathione hydrolase